MNSNPFISEINIAPYRNGHLNGLSFAVKDCIDIKNTVTGFGNPTWANTHPKAICNAVCVEQLLLEGATCKGKTISDELTLSLMGENYFYGTPLNPKFPDRIPGGSSSGSASSVASNFVDFALGTDTGGSIRVPASNCGIYGFRPTHGRISYGGALSLAPTLDTIGVLANNYETLEAVSKILLGVSGFQPDLEINKSNINNTKRKIIAIEDVFDVCDKNIIDSTLEFLKINNIEYSMVKLSDILFQNNIISHLTELFLQIVSCESWSEHGSWIESNSPQFGENISYTIHHFIKLADRTLIGKAISDREKFILSMSDLLLDNSILVFPTTPSIPPKKEIFLANPDKALTEKYAANLMGINAISGLAKLPQITIPFYDNNGLPFGISFISGNYKDILLFDYISQLITR